jgi:hypothetical protein
MTVGSIGARSRVAGGDRYSNGLASPSDFVPTNAIPRKFGQLSMFALRMRAEATQGTLGAGNQGRGLQLGFQPCISLRPVEGAET